MTGFRVFPLVAKSAMARRVGAGNEACSPRSYSPLPSASGLRRYGRTGYERGTAVSSDILQFFIPLVPVGQMRLKTTVRGRHGAAYKDPKQRAREDELRHYLMLNRPPKPWTGTILLGLKMFFPIPASWSKKRKEQARMGLIGHIVKPDFSNCLKHIEDVGNGILWADDSQIRGPIPNYESGKFYSDRPGWEVVVKKWRPVGSLLEVTT